MSSAWQHFRISFPEVNKIPAVAAVATRQRFPQPLRSLGTRIAQHPRYDAPASPFYTNSVQVLKGALTHLSFALYISRILGPRLRRGDVLVLDNLRVHHFTGLREWLAAHGVEVLFLPPYSPDFTPVKQAWSKLKTALRHVQARTQLALQEAIQTSLPWITPTDANHCGCHVHRS